MPCRVHGDAHWSVTKRGSQQRGYCKACNYQHVKERRVVVKRTLIAEAGSACVCCGYDRCERALEFHHVDPALKEFSISKQTSISLDRARAEAAKCVLLCSNCHQEVEAGLVLLPGVSPPSDKRLKE